MCSAQINKKPHQLPDGVSTCLTAVTDKHIAHKTHKDYAMNQQRKATPTACAQALADEHAAMLHQQNQQLRRQLSHERTTVRQTRAALHRLTWLVQLSEREADQSNYAANVRTVIVVIALLLSITYNVCRSVA